MHDLAAKVSRRKFGLGAAAMFGLTGSSARLADSLHAQDLTSRIDVHCHVFNASDLPVGGFLHRVIFEDYSGQIQFNALKPPSFVSGLLATLVRFLSIDVITARQELVQLRDSAQDLDQPFDPYSPLAQDSLARALREVIQQDETALQDNHKALGQVPLQPDQIDSFVDSIRRELNQTPISPADLVSGTDFNEMAAGLFGGAGVISRNVRWAAWLRGPRSNNVHRLLNLYSPDGLRLYTPALVNYAQWLDEEPRSKLKEQVLVMEEIQRLTNSGQSGLIHCFAPYDPWQQVADELANKSDTSLNIAQDAVLERGFVGVKLYPPMGFLPANNTSAELSYPEHSVQIPDFKTKIDAALDALYSWAESNDVPIMAHANNSNGAGPGYSERAHPKHWIAVLERYPKLRLNLAHFGGFDELPPAKHWEETIGGNLTRFKNLYADISYLSEALPAASLARQRQVAQQLAAFTQKHDPEKRRLLYGSDWIMLGRESNHGGYFTQVQSLASQAGFTVEDWNRITRHNAVAFLGLSPSSASRGRLHAWYAKHGLDNAVLTQFD